MSAGGAFGQDAKLTVPNVTVTAPAAPVVPPYMRDPSKAYSRNPYFGRARVEEEKFREVPCSATRIAFGPTGKCLAGYRLSIPEAALAGGPNSVGSNPCDMVLDVVMANGSPPRNCFVLGYMGYDQEDFQDMNQEPGHEAGNQLA
jgi:hypothetical protein